MKKLKKKKQNLWKFKKVTRSHVIEVTFFVCNISIFNLNTIIFVITLLSITYILNAKMTILKVDLI